MSKTDMARLGLSKGDLATLKSDHGEMTGVSVFPFDLPDGDVMAYYPEANVLTGNGIDPRSKTPSFKLTPIDILPEA